MGRSQASSGKASPACLDNPSERFPPTLGPMIVFAHLLNDRSGSPRVLHGVMLALKSADPEHLLYLGEGGDGFLGEAVPDARRYPYRRRSRRWATLWAYLRSQLSLGARLWRARDIDADAVIYVNTLLPFAAALFGRLTGRRVVCHLHEASLRPRLLQWFLLRTALWSADRLVCVSEFQKQALGVAGALVVPNAVEPDLYAKALRHGYTPRHGGAFRVCMLCSLRDYKGVPEFLRLAHQLADHPDIAFELVVSDDVSTVSAYFAGRGLPAPLVLTQGLADASLAYARASLVVNLSRVDLCQETFGLTLLEAMAFGIPVIAPPVGGPAELVQHGVQGYLVDSRNAEQLKEAVLSLARDEALCMQMSDAGRAVAQRLSPETFEAAIRRAVFPS